MVSYVDPETHLELLQAQCGQPIYWKKMSCVTMMPPDLHRHRLHLQILPLIHAEADRSTHSELHLPFVLRIGLMK